MVPIDISPTSPQALTGAFDVYRAAGIPVTIGVVTNFDVDDATNSIRFLTVEGSGRLSVVTTHSRNEYRPFLPRCWCRHRYQRQ